jgi:hypothetical protein
MKFNMLEVLTAQVYRDHMTAYGKGVYLIRDRVKTQIESHRAPGSDRLDILILSDLWYGSNPLTGDVEDTEGTRLLTRLMTEGGGTGLPEKIQDYLKNSSVSARWIKTHNPPPNTDAGNFDLHAIYALLDDLPGTGPKIPWDIIRTVYADLKNTDRIRIETTRLGVQRESVFWDSNSPLLGDWIDRFDLIVMRRGLCYCGAKKPPRIGIPMACCGAARRDQSDAGFLLKVHQALRNHQYSAAYLAGWNSPQDTTLWQDALSEAKLNGQMVPAYAEFQQFVQSADTCGLFLSRGRAFSTQVLTVQ